MKTKLLLVFACTAALLGSAHAADSAQPASPVSVIFISPEKFTDVRDDIMDSDGNRDRLLGEIKANIENTARQYVGAGQTLEIKVTDIDLAGDFEPWRGAEFSHIRMLKEIYPPRMDLEFKLVGADGKVISEGKRHLQDLTYLMTTMLPASDTLRFDKEMVRSWVRQEFKRAS
jgi:hypothetical protein